MKKITNFFKQFIPADIFSVLVFFCTVPIVCLKSRVYSVIGYAAIAAVCVYLAKYYRLLLDGPVYAALGICICVFISTLLNSPEPWQIRGALDLGMRFFVIIAFTRVMAARNLFTRFVTVGKYYLTLLIAVNDLLMLLVPDKFYNVVKDASNGTMVLGHKFEVSFAHYLLLVLWYLSCCKSAKNKKDEILRILLFFVPMCIISYYVNCMTGVVLGAIVIAFLMLPKKLYRFMNRTWVFMLFMTVCTFVVFFIEKILSFKPLEYIVNNLLHRSVTMTGRTSIYPHLGTLFLEKPLFGHGYKNTVIWQLTRCYNAHNAMLDILINYGLIACVLLAVLCLLVCLKSEKRAVIKSDLNDIWQYKAVVLAFIFVGIAEALYSTIFFLLLALLYGFVVQKQNVETTESSK